MNPWEMDRPTIGARAAGPAAVRGVQTLHCIAQRVRTSAAKLLFVTFLSMLGTAHAQVIAALPGGAGYSATNGQISARLNISHHTALELRVTDLRSSQSILLPALFSIALNDGTTIRSQAVKLQQVNVTDDPPTAPGENKGKQLCADFEETQHAVALHWCLVIRAGAGYLRTTLAIHADDGELPVTEVRLIEFHDSRARVAGTVSGSPLVVGNMFLGLENPLSRSSVERGQASARILRVMPLRPGAAASYSAVIGAAPAGQMRRSFLKYIETERPRPYRPFLHYNSWYDIGYGNRYGESAALDRIRAFGTQLVNKRGVQMDSFLFDDGWDNPDSLWDFNKEFPNGFAHVSEEAQKYGAGIGVWLSPWGGYNAGKERRIAFGRSRGYEIVRDGFALSGSRYFQAFEQVSRSMIQQCRVNQFKFDGAGNVDGVFPGSLFDSDFDAAIHLIQDLRTEKHGVFINLTTGTWASPFWLLYADSIWRGGEDHDFAGPGPRRQQWITYRDAQTHRNIVQGGPLMPLNSIMQHGIIYAQQANDLDTDPENVFEDEVHDFFASGTQLQEMYITPSLLTPANWDVLARYAQWSRAHAEILRDTHWIGGDPGKLEVYGWAAWNPQGWIITLRNPSNLPREYTLHLQGALELPANGNQDFTVHELFRESKGQVAHWTASRAVVVHLNPFEIRTYESGSAVLASLRAAR